MRYLLKQIEVEAIQWTGSNEDDVEDFIDDVTFREITYNVYPPTIECYVFVNDEFKLVDINNYIVYDSKFDKISIYTEDEFKNKFTYLGE